MDYRELISAIDAHLTHKIDNLYVSCEGVDCLVLELEKDWVYFTVEKINGKYMLTIRTFNFNINPTSLTRRTLASYSELVKSICNSVIHYN